MLRVDMENLVPIGEFAAASRLSQKALRLYAENGLLPPAWVDPGSGYRYYRLDQVRTATLIALLRRAGLPLAEIRIFLRDPSPARLDEYERQLAGEFAERRRVLRYVKRVLKEEPMYDVLTKQIPEQTYTSRSKRVRIPELDDFLAATFDELGAGDADGPPFVLYHGPVNAEEDGPVEVCVPAAAGEKSLPAVEVAFTQISGSQCDFPEILGAYESVYRWAKEHGRRPDGPPREIHLSRPDEELRMEIALPLR
jgi:DNA-binding transcriptional MerR regulator